MAMSIKGKNYKYIYLIAILTIFGNIRFPQILEEFY